VTPLSLRNGPPREPRAEARGIVFLPRSIDKFRAALPGGDLGPYGVTGLTTRMLEKLGISEDEMMNAVGEAPSEEAVVEFVLSKAPEDGITAWNQFILTRVPREGRREELFADYPWLERATEQSLLAVDLLREDDRHTFM